MSDRISVGEIARLLLPQGRGQLAMLSAYFDDSGTHDDANVVVIAGLMGNATQWAPFDDAWRAKLLAPVPGKPPLKRFHMTDCEAGEGEFKTYSRAERDMLIHDFREIILGSKLYGYGIGASRRDWREIITGDLIWAIGDDELFCFADCVSRMRSFATEWAMESEISLVFDDRPHREDANKRVFGYYQKEMNDSTYVGISFLNSTKILPLQGADLWAWETYNHTKKWLATNGATAPRPHFLPFHNSGRFEFNVADRKSIEAFAQIVTPMIPRGGPGSTS